MPWRHAAVDVYDAAASLLDDITEVERRVQVALEPSERSVEWFGHRFEPHGVSLVGTAATLRVVVHTWPERRGAAVDVWTHDDRARTVADRCASVLQGRCRVPEDVPTTRRPRPPGPAATAIDPPA